MTQKVQPLKLDLRRAILEYVEAHNEEGKPFKWTYPCHPPPSVLF